MAKANELDLDDDLGMDDDLDLGGDLDLDGDLDLSGDLGDDLSDDLGADLDADMEPDLGGGLDDDLGDMDELSDELGDDTADLGDMDLDADLGDADLDSDLGEAEVDLSNLEEELGEAAVEAPEVEEIGDLDAAALDEELGEFAVEEGDKDDQVELDSSFEVPKDMADADEFEEEDMEPALDLDDDLGDDLGSGLEDDLGMDEAESAGADDDDPFAMPGGLHEDEDFNLHDEPVEADEYSMGEDADLDIAGAMMSDYDGDAGLSEEDDGVSDDLEEQAFSYSNPFEQPPSTSYHAPEPPAPKAQPEPAGMLEKNILFKLPHQLSVEVGKASLKGEDIASLTYGSIIELDRKTGDPVDIVLGGEVIAKGEVVRINEDQLGVRITRIDI